MVLDYSVVKVRGFFGTFLSVRGRGGVGVSGDYMKHRDITGYVLESIVVLVSHGRKRLIYLK